MAYRDARLEVTRNVIARRKQAVRGRQEGMRLEVADMQDDETLVLNKYAHALHKNCATVQRMFSN